LETIHTGFGSIDKSPNEVNNDNYSQYNFISNVNAGQVLPPKWGVQIPISYTFSKEITKPKYDGYYMNYHIVLQLNLGLSYNSDVESLLAFPST
jgi:cell surface protein SprA